MIAEQTDFSLKKLHNLGFAFFSLAFCMLVVFTYIVGSTFGYTAGIWLVVIEVGLILAGIVVYQKFTEHDRQLQHFTRMQTKSNTDLLKAVSSNDSSAAFIESIGTNLLKSTAAVCDAAEFLNFRSAVSTVNENQNDGQEIETGLLGNAKKLHELGSDIVEFSHLSKGNVSLVEQEIDPAELLKACISIVKKECPANRPVALEEMENSRLLVIGDLAKLKVLLIKLIGSTINLLQAEGGTDPITICLHATDKGLTITVKMGGYHLTDNRFNQLCAPLQNHAGHHSENNCYEFGLKLAIARQLARLHGGDIFISDQSPSGTVLTFCLPAKRIVKIAPNSSTA